jgi:hypothetical protein
MPTYLSMFLYVFTVKNTFLTTACYSGQQALVAENPLHNRAVRKTEGNVNHTGYVSHLYPTKSLLLELVSKKKRYHFVVAFGIARHKDICGQSQVFAL